MKKIKTPIVALSAIMLSLGGLVACSRTSENGNNNKPNENGNNQGQTVDIEGDKTYEEWLSEREWNKPGHLYFHYLRKDKDGKEVSEEEYAKYAIWLWQASPKDQEGTLWGASNKEIQSTFNCMSTSWLTNLDGKGATKDETGHIIDIDLTRTNLIDGKAGQPVSYDGTDIMGFLIVDQTTMNGGTHWTSDGSKNMYIPNFQKHWREDGSMHIFCTSGSVDEYAFTNGVPVTPNPTIHDTTKKYVSTSNVNSSSKITKPAPTASSFKHNGTGYQVFVQSFRDSNGDGKGDINGIRAALKEGFFDDLSVDTLWLTPVQKCESYHGYDAMDYFDIDPRYGTMADYENLLKEAHEKGIKVLMDLVLNHSSKNNEWFIKSQKAVKENKDGKEVNWRDVYNWKYSGDEVLGWNLEDQKFEPTTVDEHKDWYKDGESNYYYYGKFGSGMPELNYDCQLTRDLVIDMAKYWLAKGVDGFRLDAVKHIYMKDEVKDNSDDTVIYDIAEKSYYDEEKREPVTEINDYSSDLTKNLNFWKDFSSSLKEAYPNCFLVGENFDGYGARIAPYYQALDSQFDFSTYYHVLEYIYQNKEGSAAKYATKQPTETYDFFKSSSSTTLASTTDKGGTHPGATVEGGGRSDFINGAFTSNHDVLRMINHVNNNNKELAYGDASQMNRAKVAAMVTMLTPGLSWIYYGDELGMSSNLKDHESIYGNSNNEDIWYRQPYKWTNGDDPAAVAKRDNKTTTYKSGKYLFEWDKHNKKLPSYEAQKTAKGSMYNLFKDLGVAKKAIAKGNMNNYEGYTFNDNTAVIHYKLGDYAVYIHTGAGNTSNVTVSLGSETYYVGEASGTTLKPYSAIVTKGSGSGESTTDKFSIVNLDTGDVLSALADDGTSPDGLPQSKGTITVKAGTKFALKDSSTGSTWAVNVEEGSFGGKVSEYLETTATYWKAKKDFTADAYVKWQYQNDHVYFGLK